MIPRLWTCKELALITAIVALGCVAAFLSIKLTRPKPFASAALAIEWQCKQSFLITTCHRTAHVRPASAQAKPMWLRQA
jgi:uncharacterized membrane protein YadS